MKKTTLLFALGAVFVLSACVSSDDDLNWNNYGDEACPKGWVETANTGNGDAIICCPVGTIGVDGMCVDQPNVFDPQPQEWPEPQDVVAQSAPVQARTVQADTNTQFVLLSAPNGKGSAYCPDRSNSLAWNGSQFKCCGKGMKSVVIPSREDSICCPASSDSARWVGTKWNDYECCPEGTVEVKNQGQGGKYACCPKGQKAINGECLAVR